MARGWESKSVESQKEDGEQSKRSRPKKLAEDLAERAQKKGSLELSRRRIVRELSETSSPVRKSSLEHALHFLDAEIKKLQS